MCLLLVPNRACTTNQTRGVRCWSFDFLMTVEQPLPHGWCKRLMLSMVLFTFTYCVLKKNKIPVSIGTTHIIVLFFCVLLLLSRLLTSWCKSIRLCLMAVARSDKMLSFFVQYFTSSELSCLDFREKKFWSCPCGRLQKPLRLGSKRPHALWLG